MRGPIILLASVLLALLVVEFYELHHLDRLRDAIETFTPTGRDSVTTFTTVATNHGDREATITTTQISGEDIADTIIRHQAAVDAWEASGS